MTARPVLPRSRPATNRPASGRLFPKGSCETHLVSSIPSGGVAMVRNRKGDGVPQVELPITPMLDMTFQLLTFFIFTYHPSAVEGQMDFSLPAASAEVQPLPPQVIYVPGDDQSRLTIVLKAQHDGIADGALSLVLLQNPGGEVPFRNLDELSRYLQEQRAAYGATPTIQIQAESKLKYAWVAGAMDSCLKAGFKQVGFAAPPDLGQDR
jgi:biopolymer transport protein ExbD